MSARAYLGDGVYVDTDGAGGLILTTEDGVRTTNEIFVEPEVLRALVAWALRHGFKLPAPEGRP